MTLPVNIEDLLHQRRIEGARIEYKTGWNPEPVIHTITAFANDFDNVGGGYIIIGAEEADGRPVLPLRGLEPGSSETIQQDLLNRCCLIEPRFVPVIETHILDGGRELLILWIPGGENRPYKCPEKLYTRKGSEKSPRAVFIRKGSRTFRANTSEEAELFAMARRIPFDDCANHEAELSDLQPALLQSYLLRVGSALGDSVFRRPLEETARDMRLVRGPSECPRPVNAGLLMFNGEPDRFFPYVQIEVVDKPDPTGIGMTEKIFRGPLDHQLSSALTYIQSYILREYVTKVDFSERAVRAFNWPFKAVEEALCNAVLHRSYQIPEPVTVTVTPEKMEILSLPGPDRSITDEDLRKKILISRRYRNRRIGDFLKELGIVEGRNTGIPRIIRAMQSNGSGDPVFATDEDRTYFLTTLPVHPLFLQKDHAASKILPPEKPPRRTREDLRRLITALLQERGSMSANEIARVLGYRKLTDTVRTVIGELLDAGTAYYRCPDKLRSKNQKLSLTGNEKHH